MACRVMEDKKFINVTSPLLPKLEEFKPLLEDIWERKWITNQGYYHNLLEKSLSEYLGAEYLNLFTNGTLPLITALQALRISGEVITTPFSFVATTHSLWWNGIKPVFVDIDSDTGNINPDAIEAAITPQTTAIMPVHVYGVPCDVERIQEIADKYNLKVIYDAAHAFGVRINGNSVLNYGDMSTLSFHATKVYNTVEGGALVCHSKEMKQKIDYLKNFGFEDEVTVVAPGINGKMDELRSAYGLLNLKQVDTAIAERKHIASLYMDGLKNVKGIRLHKPYMHLMESNKCEILRSAQNDEKFDTQLNYAYFPIFVEPSYSLTRDELYAKMKENGILGRRYFYPLITEFSPYKSYESAKVDNLPVANKIASEVICLPIYKGLSDEDVERVISIIKQ